VNICKQFITNLPKAELHVHSEGTMEPAQLLLFAERNNISIPDGLLDPSKTKYIFSNYQGFLDAYIQATNVLQKEQDFYELTLAYLKKASEQGVLHTEIFFDIQTYFPRNIDPKIIIYGMDRAFIQAKKLYGIDGAMIMCFLRHLSEEDAFKALEIAYEHKDKIVGIGLASLEQGNPPSKFERAFARAREYGFHIVAHAGECLPKIIHDTVTLLKVERIDHGVLCMQDAQLVQELVQKQIPITVCPLSNIVLGIFKTLHDHPLKKMLDTGLMVTINSDDPAFFGGYIADNYLAVGQALGLTCHDLILCARNSFIASFVADDVKRRYLETLDEYVAEHSC